MQVNNNGKNGILIIILLALAAISVLFFPKIYDLVNYLSMPKIDNPKIKEEKEEKEIGEEILETIHYPMMRNSIYNYNTYYSLDKFTTNDISNDDILLTAFLDVYEGNMTSYEGVGSCTSVSKQFNKDYLGLRIKNIIGNKVNYILSNFYVPEDSGSKYVGNWIYDDANSRFIYDGLCSSNSGNTKYYNLEQLIKIEYEDYNDIAVYYYVGFAKVDGNNYEIYNDSNMNNKIDSGTFSSLEELNKKFEKMNKKDKKIYKYLFKNNLCSYNEYCFYEGKWVNDF